MDFFYPVVEVTKQCKNFISVLHPIRKLECNLFNEWADGFIDRDGKIVEEFQTTFNSTFWEVYLYASFKEYGFIIDWSHASPDFSLNAEGIEFTVEAATANSAQGKLNEWDRTFSQEETDKLVQFKELNIEAIIRLSNTILSKVEKYGKSYKALKHVSGKPFVLAIAPFEQPYFNLQYDRPIRALLYDRYVDEDAYLKNPKAYPNGPPVVQLGYVTKENGAEIPLGIFNDSNMSEISAIIFSCTATWGKLSAISGDPNKNIEIHSIWATPPDGVPEKRICTQFNHEENVLDGLQIYHNPYATYPLSPEIFRKQRIVQNYVDAITGEWVYEGRSDALHYRQVKISPK